jgi:hypothetical protein
MVLKTVDQKHIPRECLAGWAMALPRKIFDKGNGYYHF